MTRKSCGISDEDLWELCEGAADGRDAALRAHVRACAVCETRLSEMKLLREGLTSIGDAERQPLPKTIGPYRVVRRIGHGACGVVFEADQISPARRVAVKILHPVEIADERALRAFRREVQALARLDHPAIATILHVGRTDDGAPYFAMQMIEGRPIDIYCSREGLPLRRRVALAARIAHAVHYAHQRGVLHRDLKPAHMLIDAEGNPHILDFGLAHPLHDRVGMSLSRSGPGIVGTLDYMSPEQMRGGAEAVDVRSDVYSLGVILYLLLTGTSPIDVPSRIEEAARAIMAREAPHPGVVANGVPHELGDIVMKAIAKDAELRYASAAALAEDLERYLAGEAVSARPPNARYKMRVFARRHRVLAAGAAAVLVLLASGVVVATMGATEIARQRDEAQIVTNLLRGVLHDADPRLSSNVVTFRQMLDATAARLEEGVLFDRPSVAEAELRETIGKAYRHGHAHEEAIVHLRRAYEIYRGVSGDTDADTVRTGYELGQAIYCLLTTTTSRRAVRPALEAECLKLHGRNVELYESGRIPLTVSVVGSIRQLEEFDETTEPTAGLSKALALVQTLPPSPDRAREEGTLLAALSGATDGTKRLQFCTNALALRQKHFGPNSWEAYDSLETLAEIAEIRALRIDGTSKDRAEAFDVLSRLAQLRELLWGDTGVAVAWDFIAGPRMRIGQMLLRSDPEAAAGVFTDALDVYEGLARTDPMERVSLRGLIASAWDVSDNEQQARLAHEDLRAATTSFDAECREDAPLGRTRLRILQGYLAAWSDRPDLARRYYEESRRFGRWTNGCHRAWTISNFGYEVFKLGCLDTAVTELTKAGDRLTRVCGVNHGTTIQNALRLAEAKVWIGDSPGPCELQNLIATAKKSRDLDFVVWASRSAGLDRLLAGQPAEAVRMLRRFKLTSSVFVWHRALNRWALARALLEIGEFDEAGELLLLASGEIRARLGDGYWWCALVRHDTAAWLTEAGRGAHVADVLAKTHSILIERLGASHPLLWWNAPRLGRTHRPIDAPRSVDQGR